MTKALNPATAPEKFTQRIMPGGAPTEVQLSYRVFL